MIPMDYQQLARIIHQERIQAAQARRPEWMYTIAPRAPKQRFGSSRRLRQWLASLIHEVAVRIEPSTPNSTSRSQPNTA
jgi:hypothetical protein